MKIEKVSENQIKCILTQEDLAARQIRLTELVYGNEKTQALFQDMMQQAYTDFGFEVNNSPIMIEAVPMPAGSIMLLITKVESPEELDTRFSRFSPEEDPSGGQEGFGSLGDLLDFFARLAQSKKGAGAVQAVPGQEGLDNVAQAIAELREEGRGAKAASGARPLLPDQDAKVPAAGEGGEEAKAGGQDTLEAQLYELTRFYLFRDLATVIRAARAAESFEGVSSLYKNPDDGHYYLILQKAEAPAEQFNRVCNILSEYALSVVFIPGIEQLFGEHMETILRGEALGDLRSL